MRILLSNDDGYFAPGLQALASALSEVGSVTVVAPERDRSGASNSLTLDRPLSLRKAASGFHYVNGTPTDCVHLAVTGMLDELADAVERQVDLDALLRLAEEGRLDVVAALLSGDRKTFEALRCEAPELVHAPVATYDWYVQHYLDRDYPIRLIMRLNGVKFPD